MAEFVKKPAIGGYKPVTGGLSNSECTHVILTLGEYAGLKREISSAQQAARNAEYNADKKIHQIQSEAQSRITDAEKKLAKNTAELEKKLAAEQQESALQRELNANLLRITKERANAERGLKPKKEHNGYVVLTSVEKESRYKDSYGHPGRLRCGKRRWRRPIPWISRRSRSGACCKNCFKRMRMRDGRSAGSASPETIRANMRI